MKQKKVQRKSHDDMTSPPSPDDDVITDSQIDVTSSVVMTSFRRPSRYRDDDDDDDDDASVDDAATRRDDVAYVKTRVLRYDDAITGDGSEDVDVVTDDWTKADFRALTSHAISSLTQYNDPRL